MYSCLDTWVKSKTLISDCFCEAVGDLERRFDLRNRITFVHEAWDCTVRLGATRHRIASGVVELVGNSIGGFVFRFSAGVVLGVRGLRLI